MSLAMTVAGSGKANRLTKSTWRSRSISVIKPSTIASIVGRSRSTIRPVNAARASRRSREWSGLSVKTIQFPSSR